MEWKQSEYINTLTEKNYKLPDVEIYKYIIFEEKTKRSEYRYTIIGIANSHDNYIKSNDISNAITQLDKLQIVINNKDDIKKYSKILSI